MSQNQFLKYLINVNIQNRSVAFYALVGIIHARKEVSKYQYSLFIFCQTIQYILRIPTILHVKKGEKRS